MYFVYSVMFFFRNELLMSTKPQPQHKLPSSDIEENDELSLSPSILNTCVTTPTIKTELERDDVLSSLIEPTTSNEGKIISS